MGAKLKLEEYVTIEEKHLRGDLYLTLYPRRVSGSDENIEPIKIAYFSRKSRQSINENQ